MRQKIDVRLDDARVTAVVAQRSQGTWTVWLHGAHGVSGGLAATLGEALSDALEGVPLAAAPEVGP